MVRLVTAALVLCIATTWIHAEEPALPGYEGEVFSVFKRAFAIYGKVKSYQDELVQEIEFEASGGDVPAPVGSTMTLVYAKPNKVRLKTSETTIVSNGKQLAVVLDVFEQYQSDDLPKPFTLDSPGLKEFKDHFQDQHPLFGLLLAEDPSPALLFNGLQRLTGIKAASLDGKPGKRVSGEAIDPNLPKSAGAVPVSVWFDDETGLIGEFTIDRTKIAPHLFRGGPGVRIEKLLTRSIIKNARVDASTPDDAFSFKPDKWYERVKEFYAPDPKSWQRKLVGRPAPAFEGELLNGGSFSSTQLKGKVVLLDFWASWCGPCIMAMPGIQKLHEKYKDKPVAVLGVNTDTKSGQRNAKQILKQREITYPHVLDPTTSVARDYRMGGIPYLVLVDKKGIIREMLSGYSPTHERQLAAQIEQLLKE